jgi:xanthine/uracil/vitamin C permease (AzgA family)
MAKILCDQFREKFTQSWFYTPPNTVITTITGCTTVRSQIYGLLRPLSADCVGIASGNVLPVAQWTRYVHVFSGSAQTGRTSGKCLFVRGFMICTVHYILFR